LINAATFWAARVQWLRQGVYDRLEPRPEPARGKLGRRRRLGHRALPTATRFVLARSTSRAPAWVSTTRQADQGESLDVQQRTIAGYAMMHGLQVDPAFIEGGVSGSVPLNERPQGKAYWPA
jgi:hypothetical protein